MLKISLVIILVVIIAIIAWLFMLGYTSKSGVAAGLSSGILTKCPDKPNCVNSEFSDDESHFTPPIDYPAAQTGQVMSVMSQLIRDAGGEISSASDEYIAATFTSSIFGFVDDLECRNDLDNHQIQIRSASRVGESDLGANRKRVEHIKRLFSDRIN